MSEISPTPRKPYLLGLSVLLWLGGLFFGIFGGWLIFKSGNSSVGLLALGIGIVSAVAGFGLYHLRRWGVVLFGILCLLGTINHLSNTLQQYANLSKGGPTQLFSALVGILVAILFAIFFIYLVIILWRQAR